jgi:hypothetical protein
MIMYKILMKKMAIFSLMSFILSKISFVLASLVALKQFFQPPAHHRSADTNKLEVVHIPIRKVTKKKKPESDWVFEEESQFIPVTYSPDGTFDTTPYPPFYYNYPKNGKETETFDYDEENGYGNYEGKFNGKLSENEIYNEHFKDSLSPFDRLDDFTEKNYYKTHVHSPFV